MKPKKHTYIHTYIHAHSYTEHMSATSSCHLSLSVAMLAASVKDRLMVAMSFLTMAIHHNGGRPLGLYMSDTLRASIRACAAGEFGVDLMQ